MKLGINGWRLHGQRTGVGRYLYNVIKNWTPETVGGRFDRITLYTPKAIDRRQTPLPENIRECVLASDRPMLVWENTLLLRAAGDDVLFCPSYSRPLFARGKTVVATHDSVSKTHSNLFPKSVRLFYNPLYGWSARHSAMVLTSTEASRQDIARNWNVPLSKIKVTYLAPADVFHRLADSAAAERMRAGYTDGAPFFLFVGKLTGRRNVPLLLDAFAEFKRQTGLRHKLVVVGPDTATLNITEIGARMGLGENLVRLKYTPDEDLNVLYNAAEALVMPSTYETVSLPVIEAQAAGTPVVCIDTAGMRELTGGAALLLPRLGIPEIVRALSRIVTDAALQRSLSAGGLENSRRFSWQRCSAETLTVLADAAGRSASVVESMNETYPF